MNWAWATSLDQIWHSPAFPMWMTLAAAGFFGLILLVTLLRADRSVANGALTVDHAARHRHRRCATTMQLYAIGGAGRAGRGCATHAAVTASLPALSCLDDLAGDAVAAGCEKALFGSPDAAAAAVSYTAAQDRPADRARRRRHRREEPDARHRRRCARRWSAIATASSRRCWSRATAARSSTAPRSVSLTDQQQVAANMDAHLYDTLVARYAPTWNAPATAPAMPATAALAATAAVRCRRASRPMPSSRAPRRRRR